MDSNKRTMICPECGAEYEPYPLHLEKGLNVGCRDCFKKRQEKQEAERAERKRRELEEELPRVIEEQRTQWQIECGLPLKFCDKTFSNFEEKLQPLAFKVMKNYYDGEGSVLLLSPNLYGVGKTHLAAAVVNHILSTVKPAYISRFQEIRCVSCEVYYTTETQLLARIRRTYDKREDDDETESDVYSHLENIEHLIIDDVGKVRPRDYSFLQGVYFRIIDSRYVNELPIILTTNLDYKELEEHIGGACADRLREMCGSNFVKMSGESYRRQKPQLTNNRKRDRKSLRVPRSIPKKHKYTRPEDV